MIARRFKRWLQKSGLGRFLLIIYRFVVTLCLRNVANRFYWRWLICEREIGNFSYQLAPHSVVDLCRMGDEVCGAKAGTGLIVLDEFSMSGRKQKTIDKINMATSVSPWRWSQNLDAVLDQRIIYYLFTRLKKPKLVFQSGTARGVGACLIAEALLKNASEGFPGRLVTTDIDPEQGYVIVPPWTDVVDLKIETSLAVLAKMQGSIDLYIHDSTGGELARQEFLAISGLFSPTGIFVSTWSTDEARELAKMLGKKYREWKDTPVGHWYRGANMAIIYS